MTVQFQATQAATTEEARQAPSRLNPFPKEPAAQEPRRRGPSEAPARDREDKPSQDAGRGLPDRAAAVARFLLRAVLEERPDELFHYRVAAARIAEDASSLRRAPLYASVPSSPRCPRDALLLLGKATCDLLGKRTLIIRLMPGHRDGTVAAASRDPFHGCEASDHDGVDIKALSAHSPACSLDDEGMQAFVDALRETYGAIFVEEPCPRTALLVPVFLRQADRVFLLAEEGRTRIPDLDEVAAILKGQEGIEPELILTEGVTMFDRLARFAYQKTQ